MLVACVAVALAALAETPPAVPETTQVTGAVGDELVGRWLVAATVQTPTGKTRPVVRTWEIRRGPEHLELSLGRAPLPPELKQQVDAAAQGNRGWDPDAAALRTVATQWGTLPPTGDHTRIDSRLFAADSFPPEFQSDDAVEGARLAISVNESFTGKEHVAQTTTVYGVRDVTPDRLAGSFVSTTMAISIVAVPITLKGGFRAYRVDPRPRSWLERLFAGCARG